MTAWLHIGDALTVLRTLPAASVDLVVTSPPYLALRSYLPADHPDKGAELGSEANPAEFIDALLDITEQLRRVLAPHGTIAIELGDTYAGSGGAGGDYNDGSLREGQPKFSGSMKYQRTHDPAIGPPISRVSGTRGAPGGTGWPNPKSLCMIPEAYRLALAYGVNPFNGRQTPRWRVRNVVRHYRPNPPVGALGDKWRPATSDWAVACVGGSRYFDLDAVRTPAQQPEPAGNYRNGRNDIADAPGGPGHYGAHQAGAPPLDWYQADDLQWADAAGIIQPTHGYPGAHYATFSPKLITRFIQCMTPARVCLECGKPSQRIVAAERIQPADDRQRKVKAGVYRLGANDHAPEIGWQFDRQTLGWSDCGHNAWRPGRVLDPFAGSGTTLEVATGHGYDAIGIELNPNNLPLIEQRVGMFLEVA